MPILIVVVIVIFMLITIIKEMHINYDRDSSYQNCDPSNREHNYKDDNNQV